MAKNLFWAVDLQHDFMDEDGKLYVPGAEAIKSKVDEVSALAEDADAPRVFSADDHEYTDDEIVLENPDPANGKFLPHCMRGTQGALLVPEARLDADATVLGAGLLNPGRPSVDVDSLLTGARHVLLLKKHFDVFTNPVAERIATEGEWDNVYVYGVATDVCVKAAIKGLVARGVNTVLVVDACAGLTAEAATATLEDAESIGVRLITVEELREELAS